MGPGDRHGDDDHSEDDGQSKEDTFKKRSSVPETRARFEDDHRTERPVCRGGATWRYCLVIFEVGTLVPLS